MERDGERVWLVIETDGRGTARSLTHWRWRPIGDGRCAVQITDDHAPGGASRTVVVAGTTTITDLRTELDALLAPAYPAPAAEGEALSAD